jgi:ABC-type amino acid transport substrate-binding protein
VPGGALCLLYFKKVRFRPVRFVAGIGGAVALCASVALCGFTFRHTLFPNVTSQYAVFKLDPRLTDGVKWTIVRGDETASSAGLDPGSVSPSIANIRKRDVLRVGFNPHAIPFSYRNVQEELVGFDISYAYRLARDLGVAIEFVPFAPQALARDLSAHRFDVPCLGSRRTMSACSRSPCHRLTMKARWRLSYPPTAQLSFSTVAMAYP